MTNEFSKRVMFLGKTKLRIMFSISLGINGLLLLGEFVYRFLIRNNVVILSETHFIPLIISLIGILGILFVVIKTEIFEDLTMEQPPNPDNQKSPVTEGSPNQDNQEPLVIEKESPKPSEPEVLTIEEDDLIEPPKLQEDRGNDLIKNILGGKNINELTDLLHDTTDDILFDSLSHEDEPDLFDIPETPVDLQYKIKTSFDEDSFGMDIEDDDYVDEELEFKSYFEDLTRRNV